MAKLTFKEIKDYLRVDYDDTDGEIVSAVNVAIEYLGDATGRSYGEFTKEPESAGIEFRSFREKTFILRMAADLYENHSISSPDESLSELNRAMLTQIQMAGDAE